MLRACVSPQDVMKWRFTPVVFLPQTKPQYPQEKNITPIPTKGHPTKYLTGTLQAVKVIKTGTVRNCHSQEEPKKMTTKCNAVPGWDTGTEKRR